MEVHVACCSPFDHFCVTVASGQQASPKCDAEGHRSSFARVVPLHTACTRGAELAKPDKLRAAARGGCDYNAFACSCLLPYGLV